MRLGVTLPVLPREPQGSRIDRDMGERLPLRSLALRRSLRSTARNTGDCPRHGREVARKSGAEHLCEYHCAVLLAVMGSVRCSSL